MTDGGVVVMKLGNAGGAKASCSDVNVQSGTSPGTGASLKAPLDSVRTLQSMLQAKAKSEAAARFYSLWDKVCREDVLHEAYRRCRANRGAPGVDGESFKAIEADGLASWLQRLRQELRAKQYRCAPLLRVWIPKANGGQRPLGIPTIRDRVAQMAVLLVLGPIFEEDLFPWQYGFRVGLDAKMALRRIHFGIADLEHAKWWTPISPTTSTRFPMVTCCDASHAEWLMGRCWRSFASGLTHRWSSAGLTAEKSARRSRATPTVAPRKGVSSRLCWPTCTSAASCWRGTAAVTRGGCTPKWSTTPTTL